MKYLDIPSLALLSQSLTFDSPECKVFARLEAYSCKNVRNERRLWKGLEEGWKEEIEGVEELSISPELKTQSLHSPFGPLDHKDSRHTHFLLVSTLNLAFPDYDFSRVKPERFEREIGGARGVLGALSGVVWGGAKDNGDGSSPRSYGSYPSALHSMTSPPTISRSLPSSSTTPPTGSFVGTHPMLHKILNDVINLDDSVVYSYVPEPESDPHEDGADDEEDSEMFDSGMDDEMMDDPDADVSDDEGMMMLMDEDEFSSGNGSGIGRAGRTTGSSRLFGGMSPTDSRSSTINLPSSSPIARGVGDNIPGSDGPRTPRAYESVSRPPSGLLWSVYYFFYNKRQKRILFLSVWARTRSYGSSPYLRPTVIPHRHPIHVVQPSSHGSMPSRSGFHASPSGLSTMALPYSRSQQMDGMPSLDGMAKSIILPIREEMTIMDPGTKAHPIRIGSATPQPGSASNSVGATSTVPGMTTAAATLAAASAAGSIAGTPPPTSPSKDMGLPGSARRGRSTGKSKAKHPRSESSSTAASTTTSTGGERLRELAGDIRAGKRIKV